MALALSVTPGDLQGTFTVSGSSASGSILGALLTGDCGLSWATVGSFVADGSQTIAVARGPWVFMAQQGSTLSPPQHIYIREDADNLHNEAFNGVLARLQSLTVPGVNDRIFKRSILEHVGGSWPVILVDIPPGTAEQSGQTSNNIRSDWGFPVRITIADRVLQKQDPDIAIKPTLERRRIVLAAFDRKRLGYDTNIVDTRVEPGPIWQNFVTDGGAGFHVVGSVITVRVSVLARRGL